MTLARAMHALFLAVAASLALLPLGGCATTARPAPEGAAALITRDYAADLIRHLYRWHFDETMLRSVGGYSDVFVLVRELHPRLDAGDNSRFLEVIAPRMRLRISLKQADYTVEETGMRVRNATFKIAHVDRLSDDDLPSRRGYEEVRFERAELLDDLFRTRADSRFPDQELRVRLGEALREHLKGDAPAFDTEPQMFHIAPLSPVSNDLWVFWENGRRLFRFSADADLADTAYWDAAPVAIEVYDLRKDVLVSFAEAPGSNAFVTRDWASRALFNCVGLGERLVTIPRP